MVRFSHGDVGDSVRIQVVGRKLRFKLVAPSEVRPDDQCAGSVKLGDSKAG